MEKVLRVLNHRLRLAIHGRPCIADRMRMCVFDYCTIHIERRRLRNTVAAFVYAQHA